MIGELDDPGRVEEIKGVISKKPSLKHYYKQVYNRYLECLSQCPERGLALELGAGAGFTKEIIPEIVTSDILPYRGVDLAIDGRTLPFADETLRFIGMNNVFHHIPDVATFLKEAQRCLLPGGRLFIVDQHVGLISKPILSKYHHEPFDMNVTNWQFESSGPLSGANGALAWIVFFRDRPRFEQDYQLLKINFYRPHTPLFYWLTGGLKAWSLVPALAISAVELFDRMLAGITSQMGSFVDIEIEKLPKEQMR